MRIELILVIIAGLVLSKIILSENTVNLATEETLRASQLGISAIALANSYVEKASSSALAFDEFITGNAVEPSSVDSIAKLPLLSTIGRDPGETSQSTYDDIDDYDGLDTMVTVSGVGSFRVRCAVAYFDPSTNSGTTGPSWYKMFTVSVTDTTPGSNIHWLQLNGQEVAIKKSVVVSYYKFL